jgi:L-alanine-DL-glutamate epimerase-like enolase superfamily enzyme
MFQKLRNNQKTSSPLQQRNNNENRENRHYPARYPVRFRPEKTASAQQDYNAASSKVSKMETLLIAVHTDNGLCGWGEAFGHLINPVTFSALENAIAPFFIGKTFNSCEQLQQMMLHAEQAFHGFGRTGPALRAVCGRYRLVGFTG